MTKDLEEKQEPVQMQANFKKALDAIEALLDAPQIAAAEITRGEFNSSGAGAAGIAFRAIQSVRDEDMEDIWGKIIAFGGLLWDNDDFVATIVLMETASRQFFIPDSMEKRIATAIEDAKNLKIMKSAEDAFNKGDDDYALQMTSELPPAVRAKFSGELKAKIDKRRATRKAAVWVAGVSISSLAVVVVIGVFSFLELVKDPPRPQLPDFKDSSRMFGDIFSTTNPKTGLSNDVLPVKSQTGSTEALPNIPGETGPKAEIFKSTQDPVLPAVRPPSFPPATENKKPIVTTEPQAPDSPIEDPIQPNMATRENCVLGFAVLQQATVMMRANPEDTTARRKVAGFMSTLKEACSSLALDPVELSLEAGMVPRNQVEAIAAGILE